MPSVSNKAEMNVCGNWDGEEKGEKDKEEEGR